MLYLSFFVQYIIPCMINPHRFFMSSVYQGKVNQSFVKERHDSVKPGRSLSVVVILYSICHIRSFYGKSLS